MDPEVPAGDTSEQDTSDKTELEVLDSPEDNTETETEEETTDEPPTTESEEDDTTDEELPEESEDEDKVTEEEEELEASPGEKIAKPGWSKIKEKYPDLAKDKDFKHFYFKASDLIELFPTVEDAKQATVKAESFDVLDANLTSGDLAPVLKDMNKEVLETVVDRFLPALGQLDPQLFIRATRPWLIDVLNNVYEYGVEQKNDIIQKSVRNVCKVLTNSSEIPKRITPTRENPEVKAEVDRLRQTQQNLYKRDEQKFLSAVDGITSKKIQTEILNGLDPENKLSEWTRSALAERIFKDVMRKLDTDEKLENSLKRIHKLAARSAFADQYKSRMISAALDRAKRLIPVIRAKHKAAAIGKQPTSGNGRIVAEPGTKEAKSQVSSAKGVTSVKDIDTSRTSELDLLNDRVHLKGK